MREKNMQFVIPAAGLGLRFKESGYKKPKPLIDIGGIPMLIWVIVNLEVTKNDKLVIVVQNQHEIDLDPFVLLGTQLFL